MMPRICICCGEAMAAGWNVLSRNPNICASCSSMLDGMEEPEKEPPPPHPIRLELPKPDITIHIEA